MMNSMHCSFVVHGLVVKDNTIMYDNEDVLIQEQGKRKLKVQLEKLYFDLTGEYMQ